MYNVYLNVSYEETVLIKEELEDKKELYIIEALTQYILGQYDCILNVLLDKDKNGIFNDSKLTDGYYLAKNMKIYKKDKVVDTGYIWNAYIYKIQKVGTVIAIKLKDPDTVKKEAEEETEFLKKIGSFFGMIHETKDIKNRCIVLDTFFKFVSDHKNILNRNGKFDDIKRKLKNILIGVEADVKQRGMDIIFEPKK